MRYGISPFSCESSLSRTIQEKPPFVSIPLRDVAPVLPDVTYLLLRFFVIGVFPLPCAKPLLWQVFFLKQLSFSLTFLCRSVIAVEGEVVFFLFSGVRLLLFFPCEGTFPFSAQMARWYRWFARLCLGARLGPFVLPLFRTQ